MGSWYHEMLPLWRRYFSIKVRWAFGHPLAFYGVSKGNWSEVYINLTRPAAFLVNVAIYIKSNRAIHIKRCSSPWVMKRRQACSSQILRRVWRPLESGCGKSNGQIEGLPGPQLPMWCICSPPVYMKTSLEISFSPKALQRFCIRPQGVTTAVSAFVTLNQNYYKCWEGNAVCHNIVIELKGGTNACIYYTLRALYTKIKQFIKLLAITPRYINDWYSTVFDTCSHKKNYHQLDCWWWRYTWEEICWPYKAWKWCHIFIFFTTVFGNLEV